ncbi:unnamed protein product [Penicillium olsonii]|nr:unnamed protein product [Penicillium olsonii]
MLVIANLRSASVKGPSLQTVAPLVLNSILPHHPAIYELFLRYFVTTPLCNIVSTSVCLLKPHRNSLTAANMKLILTLLVSGLCALAAPAAKRDGVENDATGIDKRNSVEDYAITIDKRENDATGIDKRNSVEDYAITIDKRENDATGIDKRNSVEDYAIVIDKRNSVGDHAIGIDKRGRSVEDYAIVIDKRHGGH